MLVTSIWSKVTLNGPISLMRNLSLNRLPVVLICKQPKTYAKTKVKFNTKDKKMKTKQSKCLDLSFGEVHLQSVHWTGSSFIQKRIRSKDLRRLFPTFSLFDRCTVRLTNESPAMSIGSAWIHSTNWKTVNLGRSHFVEFRFDCFRKKSRASSTLRLNPSFLNSKKYWA